MSSIVHQWLLLSNMSIKLYTIARRVNSQGIAKHHGSRRGGCCNLIASLHRWWVLWYHSVLGSLCPLPGLSPLFVMVELHDLYNFVKAPLSILARTIYGPLFRTIQAELLFWSIPATGCIELQGDYLWMNLNFIGLKNNQSYLSLAINF